MSISRAQLIAAINQKQSFLCVGLDTDIRKIPTHLLKEANPVLAFNKTIIEATAPYAIAYKINTAFYEAQGTAGWETMQQTLALIHPGILTIADAKRGDIGNTGTLYAEAFFKAANFDAVTVAPYMGKDSVQPFIEFENKWAIVLGLTSNPGSADFQLQRLENGSYLFEEVLKTTATWGTPDNLMFVIGATRAEMLERVRAIVPDNFLLVPGVGAQGGSLQEVARYGMNKHCGLLVNASRSILYASNGEDFADAAAREAKTMQQEMAALLAAI